MSEKLKWVPDRRQLKYLTRRNLRVILMRAYKRVREVCYGDNDEVDDFDKAFVAGAGTMMHLTIVELEKIEGEQG